MSGRNPTPATEIPSRRLRTIGMWTEQDWQMQDEPPILVKHLGWSATCTTTHQPTELALAYWAQARLKPAQMEILSARIEQERFAIAKLEAMVWAATQGYAYVTPPALDRMIVGVMVGLLKTWTEQGQYPLNYAGIIEQAVRQTFAGYNAEIAACEAFKAHLDPDHRDWGLRVQITPLVPTTPLIETT